MIEPKCHQRQCRHFEGAKSVSSTSTDTVKVVCPAFPDGIPDDIAYGSNKHLKPYPGQRGFFIFEKAK